MDYRGQVQKLEARLADPVSYFLPLGEQRVALNPLLGCELRLRYTGRISCVHCGRATNKSFNQGYCYPCFQKLAQCDSCIISPERCHYAAGTCREPVWGDHFCMQDHIVYLANSSGLKVGITRASQVPVRWMDQGATQALAILRTRSRQQAGFCEVLLKQHVTDRTNWRNMLKGDSEVLDMEAEAQRLLGLCASGLDDIRARFGQHAVSRLTGVRELRLNYPVQVQPERLQSHDLDKEPELSGPLLGIKGQYLMVGERVINIRKYTGYEIELVC
jgi:hypothetical protein